MIELLIVVSSFFCLCGLRRLFSRPVPSSYLLAPGASMSEIWLLGAPANWFVLSLFLGGSCWDGGAWCPASLKKSSCVISESKCMIFSVSQLQKSLLGVQAAGQTKELVCAESFWGGVLLGIMLADMMTGLS